MKWGQTPFLIARPASERKRKWCLTPFRTFVSHPFALSALIWLLPFLLDELKLSPRLPWLPLYVLHRLR
jgi:hypothetical protein